LPARKRGYRGHNHPQKFRVWISSQVRRITAPIRREMPRRAAVEPVIDPIKAEHRMGGNHLRGRDGDRINQRRSRPKLQPTGSKASCVL
jgi:IS5 family transposase